MQCEARFVKLSLFYLRSLLVRSTVLLPMNADLVTIHQALRALDMNAHINMRTFGNWVRVEALDSNGGAYIECFVSMTDGVMSASVYNVSTLTGWTVTDIPALVATLSRIAGVRMAIAA
jgi:hypothetical protein